jgi:hypothetical protein
MGRYNYFDDDEPVVDEQSSEAPKRWNKQEIADALKAFSVTEKTKIKHVAQTISDTSTFDDLLKSKKRAATMFLILVVILVFGTMIAAVAFQMNSENKKINKFNHDAAEVCSQYISDYGNCSYENLYSNYGIEGYRMTGLSYVRQMDFDDDGESELLISYNDGGIYFVEVWGYNSDGDFVSLFREKATQTNDKADDVWITIYRKNNKYYIGVHNADDITQVDLYTRKGDEFDKKSSCTYEPQDQAFIVRKKVNVEDFERIKLSVLREEKAVVTSDLVSDVIDGFSTSTSSTTSISSTQSLNYVYYSIISEYNQRYGVATCKTENGVSYIDGLAVVKLIDFDGDDKDELMLIYRKGIKVRDEDSNGDYISKVEYKYFCEVYRYNGSGASLAYENEGLSSMLNDTDDIYTILKYDNKKYMLCNNTFSTSDYGKVVNASSSIMRFDGTTFKSKFKAEYVTDYGWTDYYIDGEEVRKSEFNEKGYKVPFFDGSTSYDSSVFEVIYLQRKSSKADDMESVVNQTQSTIQKLNSSYSG